VLYNCLSWYKFVYTHLYHCGQLYNIHIFLAEVESGQVLWKRILLISLIACIYGYAKCLLSFQEKFKTGLCRQSLVCWVGLTHLDFTQSEKDFHFFFFLNITVKYRLKLIVIRCFWGRKGGKEKIDNVIVFNRLRNKTKNRYTKNQ